MPCRCCGNEAGSRVFVAPEISYGTREPFDYLECAACGSLQIREIPADLSRFYPADYYAYTQKREAQERGLKHWLKRCRTRAALGAPDPAGWLALKLLGRPAMLRYFRLMGLRFDSCILDVGCGAGELLATLRNWGFTRLEGIDAFASEAVNEPGLRIRLLDLAQLDPAERFDALLFNHSFEHLPDPAAALRDARQRLTPGGGVLIRIPVAGCRAWREYGVLWAGLDAPRHLCIPSEKGMRMLAERCGFEVSAVIYDSSARQFWVSEQNRKGIPVTSPESFFIRRRSPHFDAEQFAKWEREARRLNAASDGDCAAFVLKLL